MRHVDLYNVILNLDGHMSSFKALVSRPALVPWLCLLANLCSSALAQADLTTKASFDGAQHGDPPYVHFSGPHQYRAMQCALVNASHLIRAA